MRCGVGMGQDMVAMREVGGDEALSQDPHLGYDSKKPKRHQRTPLPPPQYPQTHRLCHSIWGAASKHFCQVNQHFLTGLGDLEV